MKAYPKHLLIGAIVMSILSMTVQGLLIFQHSQGKDLVLSPNTPQLQKPKTTEKPVESNVDVSVKGIQDQKNADVTKIMGILEETQISCRAKKISTQH
jgi:hypothetical protein